MAKTLSEMFANLILKSWSITKARCVECGYKWTAFHPKIKGGEYKLQCPKCKKRNSEPINK